LELNVDEKEYLQSQNDTVKITAEIALKEHELADKSQTSEYLQTLESLL
jgi:hypothetical protein